VPAPAVPAPTKPVIPNPLLRVRDLLFFAGKTREEIPHPQEQVRNEKPGGAIRTSMQVSD
jgi:hypothetical protein